ncbi:chemotaxis signal transduction protein [Bacillus sp. OxB-1]|uniref:chemotaxis protein CheW n=1 Tax=Bacillus sp. (strain OxB-1) TaxID=98228 RepID=UPI00058221AE|nr:CheW domain-containing protein [Bacillus sp. OxB-1]BAQ11192.1 chemotaxis signal transduction protein [Bacillus sp. OxB-1]
MAELKVVIVQCGNEEYALPVDSVVSIERLEQVNPIPHLPDYMLGLMRIRGELVPILDFEQILYGRSAKGEPDARVVVVQTTKLFIGLLVLDAKEIIDIPENTLTDTSLMAYSRTPYFKTVANLEDRMVTVVDPEVLSETLAGMDEIGAYVEAQAAK